MDWKQVQAEVGDLSRFDEDYRNASTREPTGAPAAQAQLRFSVPDGRYRVAVECVELTTAKSSGNPLLKWRLRIISGPFENKWIFKNRAITPATIEWVKKEISVCGLQLEPFSDLPHRLADLVSMQLEISKVTKGEYENIYLNKRLTSVASENSVPADNFQGELGEEIPF